MRKIPDLRVLAGTLAAATGWRRRSLAVLFGALATLAMPPAFGVPLLLLAVPGLLWLLDGAASRREAFALGWWFGFSHFVFGLYWISFALLVDVAKFWWLMPVAVAGLPAGLALFVGLVTLTVWSLPFRGLARVIAFAMAWTLAEWLRGHLFTGFPWLLAGYAWVGVPPVLQTVAVTGVYGLSLLTILVAGLPALFGWPDVPRPRARGALAAGVLVFAGLAAVGGWRLVEAGHGTVPDVRLRLVQADIPQTLKWAPEVREANFRSHLVLSAAPPHDPAAPAPTAVIWSETAIPFFLAQDPQHRFVAATAAPPGGLLLTGAPRAALQPDRSVRFWNSLIVLDDAGRLVASYDKFHLVPFGEYMPGRNLLPSWLPIATIAAGSTDFSAGPGPQTLRLPGLPPVSPLICYEAIFPGAVVDAGDRPQWLLNLTNDGWYGRSAGPHQHFAIAQTRAVEEGMPLVRVANTGISGVVDSYGRITAWLGLGQAGFIDAALPAALPGPTLYGRFGDGVLGLLLLGCALILMLSRQSVRPAP
jgi:apolipoprotein N-acyltransferase